MFRRVLVANRGEIAQRVIRACRELDVETVAVYSEADREAPWLEAADRKICIGPGPAERSYLNATAILQSAEQTDCQALHPGYGFLAENAQFAARCEQQGITFIGPDASSILRMGDKARAKRTMEQAGLRGIPGSEGLVDDADEAAALAGEIGYPVLLKATAGGGGKGLRFCGSEEELRREYGMAAMEADKAFGNRGLYLEKYIEAGRHVEFQIVCDVLGGSIHLGERECSIQRHHQKLVEESPSPALDAGRRREIGERVARAVAGFGYRNAGTVEFLLAPDGELYFMEMNTRLQVEHPVTEMVTGIDIVKLQLRVAASEPIDIAQEAVRMEGHAVEFRINAEDPDRGFKPDPGTIRRFRPPPEHVDGVRVRWDSAIRSGYRLSPYYDSMVGKLIVHGADRRAALAGARQALSGLEIDGIRTTRELHERIVDAPAFVDGRYDVNFLSESGLLADGG